MYAYADLAKHGKIYARAFAVMVPIRIDAAKCATWLTLGARFKIVSWTEAELACGACRVETCLVTFPRGQLLKLAYFYHAIVLGRAFTYRVGHFTYFRSALTNFCKERFVKDRHIICSLVFRRNIKTFTRIPTGRLFCDVEVGADIQNIFGKI